MAHKALAIIFTSDTQETSDVDATFSAVGDDWIRVANNAWIVWTERTPPDWLAIFKPYTAKSFMFIAELDMKNWYGWEPPWVWEWMKNRRDEQQVAAADIIHRHLALLAPPAQSSTPNALTGEIIPPPPPPYRRS